MQPFSSGNHPASWPPPCSTGRLPFRVPPPSSTVSPPRLALDERRQQFLSHIVDLLRSSAYNRAAPPQPPNHRQRSRRDSDDSYIDYSLLLNPQQVDEPFHELKTRRRSSAPQA
eukprot:Protomagalhaensia_sp_Gyna_25__2701@NODE_2545_length_1023_cov_113_794715_g2111_i0_p3_GENE_NODE_2545_length_1023_cov_113_794715_g2111_i0NODE_2545_length_1023_cov_113_794715_g2111_i0_p3_ORF_typecomplete_len114_score12_68_NODE_2545_length_1023_cov_113_794715_g2111_i0236577